MTAGSTADVEYRSDRSVEQQLLLLGCVAEPAVERQAPPGTELVDRVESCRVVGAKQVIQPAS